MKRVRSLFLFFIIFPLLVSCSKSKNELAKQMSGVWRAQDGATYIFDYTGKKMLVVAGGEVIPATVGPIDNTNESMDLHLDYSGGSAIWTLKRVWDKNNNDFNLVITLNDGTREVLSFVRKVARDDLM